jgi:phospholipid/cholesterol/gamma-HCH transport system substrate-binding protein
MSPKALVGAFFTGAILLLGYLTVMVEHLPLPFLPEGRLMKTRFSRVDGLERGATVTVAGVPSGEVRNMVFEGSGVIVEISLDSRIRLTEDSTATIAQDSLLGRRVLSIQPGSAGTYIADGEMIPTIPSAGVERAIEALGKVGDTAERVGTFIDSLDQTRAELEARVIEISDTFVSIADKVESLLDPLTEVAEGLRNGEGTIGRLLKDDSAFDNIDETLQNLSEITNEIRHGKGSLGQLVYSSETIDNLNSSLAPLKDVMAKINRGDGTLGKAVNDPELYNNLNQAFRSFSGAVSDIKVTMANMRQITDKINRGEGTLGSLVNDKQTLKRLNDTMSDVGEAAETLTDTQSLSVFLNVLGLAF